VGSGKEAGVSAGVGECAAFPFFFGEALGEGSSSEAVFFFFLGEAEAFGSGVSEGEGLALAFDFFGEAEGEGDSFGDGVGFEGELFVAIFFFAAVELLRCFAGVGVGVVKIFLILSPSDCSACVRSAMPRIRAIKKRMPVIFLSRRMEQENSTNASHE
jgi:hypothetical protein